MQRFLLISGVLIVLAGGGLWYALQPEPQTVISATTYLQANNDIRGYAVASPDYTISFPRDHGLHPDFKTEWWYYTGNLQAANGDEYGYQLTFFRQALAPPGPERSSPWAANNVYFAHFALADIAEQQFYAAERFTRGGALNLAGVQAEPYEVFIEDWSATGDGFNVRLQAEHNGIALDLQLESQKPPTLQGEQGYSPKAFNDQAVSHYYSLTSMETRGTLSINQREIAVTGTSWFDHEWSTSLLDKQQTGWNWFSFHLDDGRDVMWFQLFREDGSIDFSDGSITGPAGEVILLGHDEAQLEVLERWQSPQTGVEYPAAWRMRMPQHNIDIQIRPLLNNQELRLAFLSYWEGAVAISGSQQGRGYVELTGYGTSSEPARR